MRAFYRGLLQERAPPETALASAMRRILGEVPRDPVFWAGFTATLTAVN